MLWHVFVLLRQAPLNPPIVRIALPGKLLSLYGGPYDSLFHCLLLLRGQRCELWGCTASFSVEERTLRECLKTARAEACVVDVGTLRVLGYKVLAQQAGLQPTLSYSWAQSFRKRHSVGTVRFSQCLMPPCYFRCDA